MILTREEVIKLLNNSIDRRNMSMNTIDLAHFFVKYFKHRGKTEFISLMMINSILSREDYPMLANQMLAYIIKEFYLNYITYNNMIICYY